MDKKYICLVCGFDGLTEPPYNEQGEPSYEICPCCGFEFGFDENNKADKYKTFRAKWISNGAVWFMPKRKPKDWDLAKQLENINR